MARPWSLSGLIATIERHVIALAKAGWVFFLSLRGRPPAAERHITHADSQESVEGSKYYPPPAPHDLEPERGELPEFYGCTRLVAIVVDLYLVHAYWEVNPEDLAAARARIGDVPARSVLRFNELPEAGPAAVSQLPQWFDVDIDLQAGNWNVQLWSAGKMYRIEMGLVTDDGELVALATSNTIRTPRAWPVVTPEQQFLRVDADRKVIELAPPPPARPPRTQQIPVPVETPAISDSAAAAAQAAEAESVQTASGDADRMESAPPAPTPGDSTDILLRRLTELNGFRDGSAEPQRPPESASSTPLAASAPSIAAISERPAAPSDLAEMAERDFVPGISSPMPRNRGTNT